LLPRWWGIIVNRFLIITPLACFDYGRGEQWRLRASQDKARRTGKPACNLLGSLGG